GDEPSNRRKITDRDADEIIALEMAFQKGKKQRINPKPNLVTRQKEIIINEEAKASSSETEENLSLRTILQKIKEENEALKKELSQLKACNSNRATAGNTNKVREQAKKIENSNKKIGLPTQNRFDPISKFNQPEVSSSQKNIKSRQQVLNSKLTAGEDQSNVWIQKADEQRNKGLDQYANQTTSDPAPIGQSGGQNRTRKDTIPPINILDRDTKGIIQLVKTQLQINNFHIKKINEEKHEPGNCKIRDKDNLKPEQLYCALCNKIGHPASYKGCPKRLDLINRMKDKKK
ncbi:hypothetical protein KPH14_012824, partial [Odynerus spinipes]